MEGMKALGLRVVGESTRRSKEFLFDWEHEVVLKYACRRTICISAVCKHAGALFLRHTELLLLMRHNWTRVLNERSAAHYEIDELMEAMRRSILETAIDCGESLFLEACWEKIQMPRGAVNA